MMFSVPEVIGLCVLCLLMGRAIQNWCNRTREADAEAYRLGYDDARMGKEAQL